ncbi:YetF domain-containing protein [Pontibacillus salicampi]|uniref:YetF domain-containing protein n=1 Tax=Pontibacillus salicampi TaxID=1449801 RepID=A0ABV6LJA7_9BACI
MDANEIFIIIARTFGTYFVILIIFRFMGKREIGELSVLDLVVFIMLAEIGVFSIEEPKDEFIHAVIPMVVLLFIQRGTAWVSLKNQRFRDLVDGKPSVIIRKGKIDENEMRRQRYNFDDLMMQLRENGTRNVGDVDYAVLEPSGKLSIFEKDPQMPHEGFVLPLIVDGEILHDNLKQNHKNEDWLRERLKEKGYEEIRDISFLTIDQQNKWYIDKNNEQ